MDLVVENEEQPSTGQYEAQSGTPRNAPDRIRTGDLRLERPTLFGPPKGPVDH